jgi:transposase
MRARIVLGCEEGLSNGAVARKLHITGATVCKWRERFRVSRLEGLLDEPRPRAPRTITDDHIEEVITATLESMPKSSTHWSSRLMAEKTGLSQTAIVRIWRAFGLQPHRVENFKFSKDPQFVEKVRDIVGLYMNPPDRAMVLCVDEKGQVQALNRTQPILPLAPACRLGNRTRLRTARRHVTVRRPRCCQWSHHQQLLPAASPSRVPKVSERY